MVCTPPLPGCIPDISVNDASRALLDPELAVSVSIKRIVGDGGGTYDRIRVCIADLHLSSDLVNDRQIRLAAKLAESHGVTLQADASNARRVAAALGNSVAAHYDGGACPDCGDPIPADAQSGTACVNCGHVFSDPRQTDDEVGEGMAETALDADRSARAHGGGSSRGADVDERTPELVRFAGSRQSGISTLRASDARDWRCSRQARLAD